jgi:hypothetical protein
MRPLLRRSQQLLHSFNFHQQRYRITVIHRWSPSDGAARRADYQQHFVISVEGLARAFVKAVHGYEAAVRTQDDLQANFTKMFPNYGSIGMQVLVADVTR